MSVIDTPDYQRGIFNPEQLLAVVTSPTTTKTVTAPANSDALWIYSATNFVGSAPSAVGVTSGRTYRGLAIDNAYVIPIQQALDAQYVVTIPAPIATSWYIVAEAWGSTVTIQSPSQILAEGGGIQPGQAGWLGGSLDPNSNAHTQISDNKGQQYVIDAAPDTSGLGHPVSELQVATAVTATTPVLLLAAPGPGKRHRVYGGFIGVYGTPGGGATIALTRGGVSITIAAIMPNPAVGFTPHDFKIPKTGLYNDPNTTVTVNGLTNNGTFAIATIYYTIETV